MTSYRAILLEMLVFPVLLLAQTAAGKPVARSGQELYRAACAACHGPDGRGSPRDAVGFEIPLPDFTDCRTASREPDSDWLAVIHKGGPARAFSEIMPAFGEALTVTEVQSVVSHLRGLCAEKAWPRGDLNMPRALATEKAFPEDEAVLTTTMAAEGPGEVTNTFVYERRFGARNQIEIKLPVNALRLGNQGWRGGIGDFTLGVKRALFHSLKSGSILSAGAEATLPTGNRGAGLGKGYATFEGFAAFGQLLPSDSFLQVQSGIEVPKDNRRAAKEVFWKTAAGRSFIQGKGLGRAWTPMIELLGSRELESGAKADWDLLPQMQVTLSKRQHIMLNVGVLIPMNNAGPRTTKVMFYLLWDWFDGGLRDGW